jgi:hypothetical protein
MAVLLIPGAEHQQKCISFQIGVLHHETRILVIKREDVDSLITVRLSWMADLEHPGLPDFRVPHIFIRLVIDHRKSIVNICSQLLLLLRLLANMLCFEDLLVRIG